MGGRGADRLLKFYSQGAFTNKLPEPDGQIKDNGAKGCLLSKDHSNNPLAFPLISHFHQERALNPDRKSARNGRENTLAKGLCSIITLSPGRCKRIAQNIELVTNVGIYAMSNSLSPTLQTAHHFLTVIFLLPL